ncbi:MAG: ComEA family DNA-binding protein [Acidobacteriota bacterium]
MQQRTVLALVLVIFASATLASAAGGQSPEGVVNINTANAEQLQLLPRVGPALAGRIIDFRETNGPFQSVDEIVAVKGIGERSFAKLEPYLTTKGETTLSEKVRSPRSTGGNQAAD